MGFAFALPILRISQDDELYLNLPRAATGNTPIT